MKRTTEAKRPHSPLPVVGIILLSWTTGCSGLTFGGPPSLRTELVEEMSTDTDLWMEDPYPTSGQMELFYERPSRGDLWMDAEDDGPPPEETVISEPRDLPPRLELLLDLMNAPAQSPP